MKLKHFWKKTIAVVMAAVTALSVLPATTAYAATGDVATIEFDFVYDSNGNAIKYNSGADIDGYHAGGKGENKFRMYVDGKVGFCIQPGVPLHTGDTLKENSSATWNALSAAEKKAVGLALLYGYQGNKANLSGSDDEKWLATQTLVWEFVTGARSATAPYKQKNTTVYSLHFGSNYPNSGARKAYDQIVEMLKEHNTVPSFMNSETKELEYKDGKYSLTLKDSNGVLADYRVTSSDNSVSISKSGNNLTLTAEKPFKGEVKITAARKNIPVVSESARMIAYGSPDLQDVITGVENVGGVSATLKIETPTGSVAIKKTSEDGVVEGITFIVAGEGINKTVTTNAKGEILIDELVPGVYTVTEQSYDRYEPQNVQRVTVIGGKEATVTFDNVLKRGNLVVTKTSEDGLVEGMKFHLYGTSISGLPVDEYAITDSSGKATFKDVLIGTGYTLEEVDTPIRYVVPDNQTAAVEWNKVTEKNFSNILKKFQVTVTKSDVETGTPQGDASLAGAEYGIYKGDELVDSYITDEYGQFTTKYYICDDDWSIREINPSEGYLLDKTSYHVGAEAKFYKVEFNQTAVDVVELVTKGDIAIIKHTDDGETKIETPEVGAVFEVYLKVAGSYDKAKETERDMLTCDENGFAQTKKMPYGVYTVKQTSGWEGRELMKPFDVFISKDGQTYRYLINNSNFESYIKVVKKDAETDKTIPYAGAGFQIYDPNGKKVSMTFTYPEVTTIDTFYTTEDGDLITPETLEYGKGYSLVEVQAPYGYVLNAEPVYFDVEQENSEEESGITVVKVERPNMAQKGVIKISKSGEVFATVTENEGIYQPVYSVQGLKGAVYEIRAVEDIYTLDGTLRASAGEVVDTVTTDESGMAESKALYLGKYEVKEITAPYGMILNEKIHTAELVYAGQEIEITETSASFYNERQKAAILLNKVMEQNDTFGVGMNGEITAVTFGLYAADTLKASDGKEIPADGLMEIISVSENGTANCMSDLPFGSYYFKELFTDCHYILSDTKYPVTFEYAGQDIDVVQIMANDDKPVENKLFYGSIEGLKKDDSGNALDGALIGLFRPDCKEFTTENALMTAKSKEDGSFSFAKIPYGDWVVREIEAPAGYVLSEELYPVMIDVDGTVVEIEITNTLIRGSVQLTKVDKDYPDNKLAGAEFEIYRDNNDNQKLDDEDEKLGTLTEVSLGIYEMTDLVYGNYLLKETKAPEGFYLDDTAYPFSITENGKTVVVENEAGKGFINMPQVGSLKIIKTSSDGKVEGFSFHVTGANGYEQVFKTDKNGEIVIENLRIGEYTVSEVSDKASAGYVLPADKKVTISEGTTVSVEMRLINPLAPDDPNGKVAVCSRNVYRIWKDTKEQRSTQLVFCDLSTPNKSTPIEMEETEDGKYQMSKFQNVYDDLKKKLVDMGIPEEEIAFIHDANTDVKKKELFAKVRAGEIRVLMGSTQKMGAGTNVQDKLVALHDLDCPWRPSDLAQRLGRIVRQGNQNQEVDIFRYVTEGTFDAYLYQLVENKQKFIAQIMTSKTPVRVADDVDETALSYSEIKALATGNPLIIEKCNLDMEVGKLNMLKASYLSQKYGLEGLVLRKYPTDIQRLTERETDYKKDIKIVEEHPKPEEGFAGMELFGVLYNDKEAAGKEIINACTKMTGSDAVFLGQYRGFSLTLSYDGTSNEYRMTMKGTLSHTVVLGADVFGNITRMDNVLEKFPEKLQNVQAELAETKRQLENAKNELEQPFQREAELQEKTERLKELNILLNMDQKDKTLLDDVPEEEPEKPKQRSYER